MSTDVFETQRSRLLAIAYGMLGSFAEAEDVVQDAWLRWQAKDRSEVESPPAFLTTMVTRMSIDRLRSARHRRETYVGPWLPEPIVTAVADDPADLVAEAEALSMALLTALERLNPVERAVFLLRDVFDLDYADIAGIVDRSPAGCRQIAVRSRERVGDPTRTASWDRDADAEIVAAFTSAAASGDVDALVEVLAADVIAWADGGGVRRAARQPVAGARRVATFFSTVTRQAPEDAAIEIVRVNGGLGLRATVGEETVSLITFDIAERQITAIRSVLNPAKLTTA